MSPPESDNTEKRSTFFMEVLHTAGFSLLALTKIVVREGKTYHEDEMFL